MHLADPNNDSEVFKREIDELKRIGQIRYKIKQYAHLLNYLMMNRKIGNDENALHLEDYANTPCGRICIILASRKGLLSKEYSRKARKNRDYFWRFDEAKYQAFMLSYLELETRYRIAKAEEKLASL